MPREWGRVPGDRMGLRAGVLRPKQGGENGADQDPGPGLPL
jgi:hypothetical protein